MHEYDQYILDKAAKCCSNGEFDRSLYDKYDVKMGLRDRDGKGVVAGLTNISRVTGFETVDGKVIPCRGKLIYRGYSVEDLISAQGNEKGLFEKCAYLLLFNEIPSEEELATFSRYLNKQMSLPANFVKDVILRENGSDLMNTMSRCVMNMAMYDHHITDMSPAKALRNCMKLIATMPLFAVYGYQAYNHFDMGGNLHIVKLKADLTVAENILRMLRPGKGYTELEALVLDRLLVLHLEHGGGNNSTFTARVVSSAGSDTYAVIVAALMSLKGPKHGGANLKVSYMADDIRAHVKHPDDPDKLAAYLEKIVNKEVFDKKGLVYGMGHAVYTESDPRAEVLRTLAEKLAEANGRSADYQMYHNIELLAPDIIRKKHTAGAICANVDLYSGFIYELLGIPKDLYTPMFAVARTVGWCAHHMEEITSSNKIIRPAYVSVVKKIEMD